MTIGDIIKKYREEHGITMAEFAEKSGISKGYLSMLERNENPRTKKPISPSLEKVKQAVDFMGMDLNEVIAITEDQLISLSPSSDNLKKSDPQKKTVTGEVIPYSPTTRIPILGTISAGLPLYAEEHIEGYTYTDLNHGGEYFGLRVKGDSMTAARIHDGDIVIIRRQDYIENGEIAVVIVGDDEATIKRYHHDENSPTVTLIPQSYNPEHKPQNYDARKTNIRILGKVVRVQIDF